MIVNKHYLKSPVKIIDTILDIPQDYKQKCINEIYNLGDSQDQSTNVKAIMTSWKIWDESKVFNELFDKIFNSIIEIDSKSLTDSRSVYNLSNAWGAIYKKGHYSQPHQHNPHNLSFVYYLKSNGSTPLIFDEIDFHIKPIDNTLIIFPSYLIHSVPPHNIEEDRVCIAGNIDISLNL